MRALGNSDAECGDFTYDKAIDFATEKGVVDMFNMDADDFMRDDVVAMSYTALSVAPKSGETDLLTKLVGDKAVDAEKAAPVRPSRLCATLTRLTRLSLQLPRLTQPLTSP